MQRPKGLTGSWALGAEIVWWAHKTRGMRNEAVEVIWVHAGQEEPWSHKPDIMQLIFGVWY